MSFSVFDLFSIGIGPSSSHTVGPMRAARLFAALLSGNDQVTRVRAEMFGSLGATGHGHGTPKAVLLGLEGDTPETVDVITADARAARIRADGRLRLMHDREIGVDLVLHRRRTLPGHPNGMLFSAFTADGTELLRRTYFSVGGGFVVPSGAPADDGLLTASEASAAEGSAVASDAAAGGGFAVGAEPTAAVRPEQTPVPHPFHTGAGLLDATTGTEQP
ncbi:MAG TPA: serine dehydratase beta chain, partial [Actinoplanes sp.]|nr:serine dehydratase beta chain [Actinoplanes sp.]